MVRRGCASSSALYSQNWMRRRGDAYLREFYLRILVFLSIRSSFSAIEAMQTIRLVFDASDEWRKCTIQIKWMSHSESSAGPWIAPRFSAHCNEYTLLEFTVEHHRTSFTLQFIVHRCRYGQNRTEEFFQRPHNRHFAMFAYHFNVVIFN